LGIALSSFDFHRDTPEKKIDKYNQQLILFQKLRTAVKARYAESIDYKDYEEKVQQLINAHVRSSEVIADRRIVIMLFGRQLGANIATLAEITGLKISYVSRRYTSAQSLLSGVQQI